LGVNGPSTVNRRTRHRGERMLQGNPLGNRDVFFVEGREGISPGRRAAVRSENLSNFF